MNETRLNNIIKKYGSLEEYEKLRVIKVRQTILKKCSSDEERQEKLKQWEWEDFLKSHSDESLIGKIIKCQRCNCDFKAPKSQQMYCSKCILELARIRRYGSLENYFKIANEHLRSSLLDKYGVDNIMRSKDIQQKAIETKKEKYGENLEKIVEKSKKTKLEKYGDEGYTNIDKRRQTNLQIYGAECNWGNPENHKKCVETGIKNNSYVEGARQAKQTKLERYGDENYVNLEKRMETNKSRYNSISPFGNKEVQEKSKQTLLKKYGVDNIAKDENERKHRSAINKANPTIYLPGVKDKIMKSCLANGGFSHRSTYYYNNLSFDSSWELYFYIYLKDNNINFIYKPERLSYIKNDKEHYYYPDFYTDHYIEIKGDHLIDDNGTLLDWEGNKLIEKTNLLKANNVEIITYKKMKPIIDEVNLIHGIDYVKSFKGANNVKN